MKIPLKNSRNFLAFTINGQLIVFRIDNASLHVLSDAAAWLFLSLDAGYSEAFLRQELQKNQIAKQSLEAIRQELNQTIYQTVDTSSYANEYQTLISSSPITSKPDGMTELKPVVSLVLLGKRFNIETTCPIFKSYLLGLSLLSGQQGDTSTEPANFLVSINKTNDNSYQLYCNGRLISELADYQFVMPRLMDHLQIVAYQSSDYLLAVHSAMLAYRGQCIMLPGQSGSGKSTLCASLISQGFSCYSDEISAIAAADNSLSPIPLPMAIKTGSWGVLQSYFPEMEKAPVWRREDGRCSKYVELPDSDEDLPNVPVKCIVFPQYAENSDCELQTLDPVTAFKRLTLAGYQIKESLTPDKVEQILNWIIQTPAYSLRYSNLEQAHTIIKQLMNDHEYC